jgi:hypothetical protein
VPAEGAFELRRREREEDAGDDNEGEGEEDRQPGVGTEAGEQVSGDRAEEAAEAGEPDSEGELTYAARGVQPSARSMRAAPWLTHA